MDAAKLAALVDYINRVHATEYRFVERAASGESGAYLVADPSGRGFILKFGRGEEYKPLLASHITQILRVLGYPAPDYICTGSHDDDLYAIQELLMPGTLLRDSPLTPVILNQLIALNRLQRGRAESGNDRWSADLRRSLIAGFDEYCRIDAMQQHSAGMAEMLKFLQRIVLQHQSDFCPTGDIVHWDFHSGNVLVENDRVTGVVDWDGLRFGDASFDLATLLFYLYPLTEVRKPILDEALTHSSAGAMKIYLAHMIVRQLDWSIRNHPPDVLEHFTKIADALVSDFLF
jgi:Phosphotransferase enzyme family